MKTWHFGVVYFFYFTTLGIFVPFWGLYLQHKGFNPTEIGQLIAILTLSKIVAPNVWAAFADNRNARRGGSLGLLKYAALGAFCTYSFMAIAEGFWVTATVMLGFCVFWNAHLPQLEAATLKHLRDRTDHYGSVRLWGSVSFILVVLGMGYVLDHGGPDVIMWAGMLALLSVFITSSVLRDVEPEQAVHQSNSKASEVSPLRIAPLISLIDHKVIFLLSLGVFMQLSHAPWQTFFSIYLESYGYSKSSIGILWSVGVIFEILVFIFAFKLFRHFALAKILSFTLLIAGVRWCMVSAFPESISLIFITQVMHAITYGLYHSVMVRLIDQLFQGHYQIRGQALYSSVTYGLGGALGSVVSGYLWSYYGKQSMFLASGVMMLLVFLVSAIFISQLSVKDNDQVAD